MISFFECKNYYIRLTQNVKNNFYFFYLTCCPCDNGYYYTHFARPGQPFFSKKLFFYLTLTIT